MNIPART